MNFVRCFISALPTKRSKQACLLFLLCFSIAVAASVPVGDVKVIVLGIAQDGGIPQIGCTQKICLTQHHFVSSLALESGGATYLFDATPDLRAQYAALIQRHPEFARKNIFDGVFLTHAHMGHYTGLMFLGKESISTKMVPVYCSAEMARYLSSNGPWSLLVSNQNIELHAFESGKPVALNGLTVTPLAVPHRKEFTDTHGFLIQGPKKSLLFIPDIDSWDPVKEPLSKWLNSADYALLDGTFYSGNELPGRNMRLVPHPTIVTSMQVFQTLPPFRAAIFFTHLNHTNPLLDPDSAESKKFSTSSFHVANEWQEFIL
jgi:pyrroloquinoline quinone biosynthesis protein B